MKVSQAKPPLIASPPLHLSAKKRVLRVDFPRGEGKCASWRRRGNWQLAMATCHLEGGGRGDLRIDIMLEGLQIRIRHPLQLLVPYLIQEVERHFNFEKNPQI